MILKMNSKIIINNNNNHLHHHLFDKQVDNWQPDVDLQNKYQQNIAMSEFDHRIFVLLKQQGERPEKFGLNGDSNHDLCDAPVPG